MDCYICIHATLLNIFKTHTAHLIQVSCGKYIALRKKQDWHHLHWSLSLETVLQHHLGNKTFTYSLHRYSYRSRIMEEMQTPTTTTTKRVGGQHQRANRTRLQKPSERCTGQELMEMAGLLKLVTVTLQTCPGLWNGIGRNTQDGSDSQYNLTKSLLNLIFQKILIFLQCCPARKVEGTGWIVTLVIFLHAWQVFLIIFS